MVRMTRVGCGFAVLVCVCTGAWASERPGVQELEYTFELPKVTQVKIAGEAYDRVTMPGVPNCGNAGEPALPASGARILLPMGTTVSNVEIVPGEFVLLGSGYLIEPVQMPVKLSSDSGPAGPPILDAAIYDSNEPFPQARFDNIGVQRFRGHAILNLKLQPTQYVPSTGELYYYPNLTVRVHTEPTGEASPLLRGLAQDRAAVEAKVDNPEAAATYDAVGARGAKSYDLLILTTDALATSFQPLKVDHDARGILTEIHTTTEVGSSDPDDVRDYIRDRYNNDGIEYVLIGADDDIIPAKNLYVRAAVGGDVEYSMPGDIYFGCLDGTWNYDGDSYAGEPTDGDGGGDVDLVAEVYVGRASVGSTTEASRFVDKTLWYFNGGHSQPEKVLLVGEYLGFGGDSEYAANTLEELIDGSSAHGYTTVGIPSADYTVDELFERDMSWSQSTLVSRINAGVHFLNHLGHGDTNYAMKMYTSDVTGDLTNDDLCFVYSQTCLAGHFDGTDCWAEYMNIKTDNGGFAVVMNARYGWGDYNTTDGPSQRFNREFWDAVFAEGMPEIGKANQDSKEDNIYRVNEDCMRWCTYELNVFGDPTVSLVDVSDLLVTPATAFVSEGPEGGPFTPGSVVYTLENTGGSAIDYSVTKTQNWVTITNGSGTLAAGGGTADVTVSINANANGLADGRYTDTVSFVNTTSHDGDTTRGVTLNVGVPQAVYEWSMDTDPGWTTQGLWAWGAPTGDGGEYGEEDPTSGYTGSNVYGYNLSGDYQNYLPETHLTSPAIDCSELIQVTLKFWRWLGVEQPLYDHAYVRVSTDGSDWTTIWANSEQIADDSWTLQEFDISSVADGEATVYLRWTMGETDGSWKFCGWNIDDVEIWAIGGEEPDTAPPTPDPMSFSSAPAAVDTSSITMTATEAVDAESGPVEYYFEFVSGGSGGNDSGWQSSRTYTDTGLAPNTEYTYRVRARDSAETPNVTSYSGGASATTAAATIESAASCRDHGPAGEMCVDLSASVVEPRVGGVTKMEFEASTAVANVSASVDCTYSTYSGTITETATGGTTVTVEFDPSLPNNDCCTVTLGGEMNDEQTVAILLGDADGDLDVNSLDYSSVKLHLGLPLDASNCLQDVNADGDITSLDYSTIKLNLGAVLAGCP